MAGWAASIPQGQRGNASLGDLAVLPDGRAYAYSGNDDVPTFLGSRRVKLGEWHNLAIVAGFATHTSRFYGDDHLLATFAQEPSEVYTGVRLRGAMLAYAAPDTATNTKVDYAAHYDKFSIKVVSGHDCERDEDDRRGDRQD